MKTVTVTFGDREPWSVSVADVDAAHLELSIAGHKMPGLEFRPGDTLSIAMTEPYAATVEPAVADAAPAQSPEPESHGARRGGGRR